MPSRSLDVPLYGLAGTSVLVIILAAWAGPSGPLPSLFAFVGFFITYSFAAYESFGIRRALAISIYRRQALGMGLVAVGLLVLIISNILISPFLPPNSNGPFGTPVSLPFIYFAFLVIFYWIDASVRAARRSDPLLRDTLHWSQVRLTVWAATLGSVAVSSTFVVYEMVAGRLSIVGAPSDLHLPILDFVFEIPFYVPIILGALYLPLIASRSKNPILRRHLGWFGIFVLMFLVTNISFLLPTPPTLLVLLPFVVLNVGGYFLYRSARSLVPLNRISPDV